MAPSRADSQISSIARANPRTVVISLGLMRIPVSASMRLHSSRLPSESRPYSTRGRSGSTVRRRIRLIWSATRRRSRPGRSSGGSAFSSARNLLVFVRLLPHGLEQFSELAALREGCQPRCSRYRRIPRVCAVVAQQCLECIRALVGSDSGVRAFRQVRGAADLSPRTPCDRGGHLALGSAPMGEGVQPAVGRGVGALTRRAHQGRCRGERAEPVQWLSGRGLVQVPRAVDLRRPVVLDQLVGDVS